MSDFPQLRIVHVSDLHFGSKSISVPEDASGSSRGIPALKLLLAKDLQNPELQECARIREIDAPLIIAATGDLTQKCDASEFDGAHDFLTHFTSNKVLGKNLGPADLFVVPGNHDVVYDKPKAEHRFGPYCQFYNKLYKSIQTDKRDYARPEAAESLTQVHSCPDKSLLVAEINSCYFVERETPDESRGQVDMEAIASLRRKLDAVQEKARDWIKIAMIHHHPVLLPSFVEAGRGVDAVLNARSLLGVLRENGFHLILHGHKHFPQVFSYDPEPAWADPKYVLPQLVVAGGSLGSTELPEGGQRCNTYNLITVKWNARAQHARVQVITRGLVRTGDAAPLDPDQWRWKTLRIFDRVLSPYESIPQPGPSTRMKLPVAPDALEVERRELYEKYRFNMPVMEVIPSLMHGQGYEARVWLVQHRFHKELPVQVTWSAGDKFDRKVCEQDAGPDFCAYFNYWGPMLIQVQMKFADGNVQAGYIYARVPEAVKRR